MTAFKIILLRTDFGTAFQAQYRERKLILSVFLIGNLPHMNFVHRRYLLIQTKPITFSGFYWIEEKKNQFFTRSLFFKRARFSLSIGGGRDNPYLLKMQLLSTSCDEMHWCCKLYISSDRGYFQRNMPAEFSLGKMRTLASYIAKHFSLRNKIACEKILLLNAVYQLLCPQRFYKCFLREPLLQLCYQ